MDSDQCSEILVKNIGLLYIIPDHSLLLRNLLKDENYIYTVNNIFIYLHVCSTTGALLGVITGFFQVLI